MFLYRLAAHHRIFDVDHLARTASIRQIRRWLAFYRLEPFGNDWRRTARATVVTAKALGARIDEAAEEMFLPTYDPTRPLQTEEQMLAELMKIPAVRKKAMKGKGK